MFRSLILFCLLLAASATSASATSYYVSPYGNDAFIGVLPELPWATIAKVNTANLRSGDQIYFMRGGVWHETLVPQVSGLYYGAYGIGARPVISGANQLNGAWTQVASNVWATAVGSSAPTQLWFSGVLGNNVAAGTTLTAPLQWSYSQGYVYAYSTANPVTTTYLITFPFPLFPIGTSSTIEASLRPTALTVNNVSNLTVEHLAFVNSANTNVCMCSGNSGQTAFNDDVFSGALNEGFSLASGSPTFNGSEIVNNGVGLNVHGGNGFSLINSIISNSYNQALLVSSAGAPGYLTSTTITGNASHNAAVEVITNTSNYAVNVQNSTLLPNPYMPLNYTYSGLNDAGGNVYQSEFFQKRAAPLVVVPFIDDYNNLAVAQAVSQVAYAAGCPLSYAVNTKLVTPAAWTQMAAMQKNYGVEIVAHTRSHSDLANNNVFSIQYTGPATSATMTINQTTNRLQTFLNGSSTPDLNLDLSNTYNGITDVLSLVPSGSPYKVVIQTNQLYFTPINLAAVANINIKTAPYLAQASANYLTWEVEGAQSDIAANLPGYHAKAFATPFTSSNIAVENHIRDAGFLSNRNGTLTADLKPNGNWLLSNLDVYNMASEFLPLAFDSSKPLSSADALVEGLGAAGGVMAVYAHGYDEFTLAQWKTLFTNLKAAGATCMTMSQANAYVEANGSLVGDGTRKNWVQSVPLTPNFTITNLSPSQGAHGLQ